MTVLEALGETGVEPHVVRFGVALLKGVSRRSFRRDAKIRGELNDLLDRYRYRWNAYHRHYLHWSLNQRNTLYRRGQYFSFFTDDNILPGSSITNLTDLAGSGGFADF
jgi:hypothetical protein